MLSEKEMDAAIDAYDRTNCKTDRGLANQEACMQAAFDAVAALRAQADAQPVAVVGSDFQLVWIGSGPIAPIIAKHNIKVGDKLYTHPAPEAAQALSDWNRISKAAQAANQQYGQWMPERWLQLFVKAYNGDTQ
jgi:hypothetical protein